MLTTAGFAAESSPSFQMWDEGFSPANKPLCFVLPGTGRCAGREGEREGAPWETCQEERALAREGRSLLRPTPLGLRFPERVRAGRADGSRPAALRLVLAVAMPRVASRDRSGSEINLQETNARVRFTL